jgi:ElaB/YqjD/DUF883 family membrane-anchored ribosome-binding protein
MYSTADMKTQDYTDKLQEYARPVMSKMGELQTRVGESARNFGSTADEYVHDHPWQTVAIVGLVACLLGFLFGNRR